MSATQLETPVLLLAFKRPETTKLVFEEIRKAQPKKLFLFCDGPRNEEEKSKVEEVRKIISDVDWKCTVKKRFLKKNAGIAKGLVSAMDWFLEEAEEGIILEDDAVPSQDFFNFCSQMLEKYRDDERVMHISGCNFQRGKAMSKDSYYFSIYPHTYGFAMWKKKRKNYDGEMKDYPILREKLKKSPLSLIERKYLIRLMDDAYSKNPNAIDTKWFFSILKRKGLCIVPSKNLVQGIGYAETSTHTKKIDSFFSQPTENLEFPLKHPQSIMRNRKADRRYLRWLFKNKFKKYFLLKTGLANMLK